MNRNPTRHSRTTIISLSIGFVLLIAIIATAILQQKMHVTAAAFQRIQIGMTRTELHEMLGRPQHQQIVFGVVQDSSTMAINFSGDQEELRTKGYTDYIMDQWSSSTITIVVAVDGDDRVVCRYTSTGQSQTLLGYIWPRRSVSLPPKKKDAAVQELQ